MLSTSHKRPGSPLSPAVEGRISPSNQHQVSSSSSNFIPSVLTTTHFPDPSSTSTSGGGAIAGPSSPRFDLSYSPTLDSREYEVEAALSINAKEYIVASNSGEGPIHFLTTSAMGGGGEGDVLAGIRNGAGRSPTEGKKRRKDGKVVEPRTSRACCKFLFDWLELT